jgi:hypothetical protein
MVHLKSVLGRKGQVATGIVGKDLALHLHAAASMAVLDQEAGAWGVL